MGVALDPRVELRLPSGARVLALGGSPSVVALTGERLHVVSVAAGQPLPAGDGFAAAVAIDYLEHEEWDRWALQQIHHALGDGGRLVLVVPNALALAGAADLKALGGLARKQLARARGGARVTDPAAVPAFAGRRYPRARLRRMLEGLGFVITQWRGEGRGLLAPLGSLAEPWASRHVVVAEKRSGYFGLADARALPDAETHRAHYTAEHAEYLGIRDRWRERNPERVTGTATPLDVAACAGWTVLVLSPHPDDEVIGCGGTLARLVAAGAAVTVIQATDGSDGFALRHAPEAERRRIRLDEAQAVGDALGAAKVLYWRADNRAFRPDEALVARLAEWLDANRPALIFSPFVTDAHADHRTLNRILALALARTSLDPATLVLGYEVWSLVPANRIVDVTDVAGQRDALLLRYPTAMKVDDFIHLCAHRQYYNAYTYAGRQGFAEAFYATPAGEFAALLGTVEEAP